MKTCHPSALILAAALSLSASLTLSAAPNRGLAFGYRVHTVTVIVTPDGDTNITRGATREYVSHVMKYQIREELSPDVWVYSGYHAELESADDQGCGSLVITFSNDKVVDLQLVDKQAVATLAASPTLGSSGRNIVSK